MRHGSPYYPQHNSTLSSPPIQEGPIMGMFLLHLLIVVVVIVAVCGAIKYLP